MLLLFLPSGPLARKLFSQNNCCTTLTGKHSRQMQTHRQTHVPSLWTAVTYFTPQMFTRSKHGHKEWMNAGNTAQSEERNRRLGAEADRINYLCSHSWGESSRFEARPTEAVYTDRGVRGHASKHVVGAKLQGLRAGHRGWEWLEIYYSFSAKSCSWPYVSMTRRIYV